MKTSSNCAESFNFELNLTKKKQHKTNSNRVFIHHAEKRARD